MSIFYYIQAHGDLARFAEVFELYYDRRNFYLIKVDIPYSGNLQALAKEENVRVEISSPAVWCGWSLLDNFFDAVDIASQTECEWFINMSATCVPLKPQRDLLTFLQNHPGVPFVTCWPFRMPLPSLGRHRTGQYSKLRIANRLYMNVDEGLNVGAEFNPLRDPALRVSASYHERTSDRQFDIVPLSMCRAKSIQALHCEGRLYFGRAWYVLPMQMTRCFGDAEGMQLREILRYSFCPDEVVPQTILMNSALRSQIKENDLRWLGGRHGRIDSLAQIDELLSSRHYFARKLPVRMIEPFCARYRNAFESQ